LFTDGSVRALAARTGIQVNVIDTAPSPASGALDALTEQTGGRYVVPDTKSVTVTLNEIRAHSPPARRADGTIVAADLRDAPVVPLVIALMSAAVLSVALLVLRR
jgi:hypothetical protein